MKKIKIIKAMTLIIMLCILALSVSACSCAVPQWLGGPHTITTVINGEEISYTVEKDTILVKPEDPVMEGYDFVGWFLDEDCTVEYVFDQPLNEDTALYAKFVEKEYTITFTVDGVENEITYKWSQTPSVENPKKDGFVFKGWCKDQKLTETYEFNVPVRENMTVYAKFAPAYKVQYVVIEGEQAEIVETENETIPIRPKDPVVEGYNFEGWFLDAEFTVAYNFDSVLQPETTIYAKLVEKQYKVTYMVGGTDIVISEITCNYFSIPVQPATPEYQGQYFFGWYLDQEYSNSYDFSYSLKTDSVIYAQFLESKPIYTIEELQAIKDYPAGNYTLMNDINFVGKTWEPIETYSGKLDGNGFKLIALSITSTDAIAGFIKTNNGTIKNLTIKQYAFTANYEGSYSAGALVGMNYGTIENCHLIELTASNKMEKLNTTGSYNAYVGSIAGANESAAVIKDCTVQGNANISQYFSCKGSNKFSEYNAHAYFYYGGAVGINKGLVKSTLLNLIITGNAETYGNYYVAGISGTHEGHNHLEIAGIVSENYGEIDKSSFNGSLTAKAVKENKYGYNYIGIGGAVRHNNSTGEINESYVNGSITELAGEVDEIQIGGFVQHNSGVIIDCYSDVDIITNTASTSGNIGGFVSVNQKTVSTCYAVGSVVAVSNNVGGFVGNNATNGNLNLSFCSVDIAYAGSAALGAFMGIFESGSSILYCQYNSESTVTLNGEAYTSEAVASVSGLAFADLVSTDNLKDTLYWNTDGEIWVIDGENLPSLAWEKTE